MKRKNPAAIFLFFILTIFFSLSCTKLDTKVYDQVSNFWRNKDQIAAGVAPAYSWLRNAVPTGFGGAPNVYNLNEMSTDEIIVPDRVKDWNDDVVWEQMWKHTWGPNNIFMSDGWQFIYGGIARVNLIIQSVNEIKPKPDDFDAIVAELKTVRALFNFFALDLFGNVPIADSNYTDLSKLGTRPRAEVFAYVEGELKNSIAQLSTEVNPETYGRATRWVAQALLAKLYLNAKVYTGTERWTECIAACEEILNSNKYSLEPDFFSNFKIANEGSKENIFVIPFDRTAGLDLFFIQLCTLHYYNTATFGLEGFCANGFCSTVEYLNFFKTNDARRQMFLVGQQYENEIQDSAHMQFDRDGFPLSFDPVITTFKIKPPKIETAGARCAKWEFNKQGWGNMSNDFALFRLSDIILMKAEAQFMNGNVTEALATLNKKVNGVSIHERAGLPDFSATEITTEGFFKERACELSWEGWRRNDMVRLGHFTDARNPEKLASADFRKLYPIPQTELDKNPYLIQNPGY